MAIITPFTVDGVGAFRMWQLHDMDGRSGEDAGLNYHIEVVTIDAGVTPRTVDEMAVFDAAFAAAPDTFGGLVRISYELQEKVGDFSWNIRFNFEENSSNASKTKTLGYDYSVESMNTTGAVITRTMSLETVGKYGPGGTGKAPDYQKLINFDDATGQVKGMPDDVVECHFVYRFLKRRSEYTMAYRKAIRNMYNRVNAAPFMVNTSGDGFEEGTMRFKGADINEREDGDYEISMRFLADNPHELDQVGDAVADSGQPIKVPPHHLLWAVYKPGLYEVTGADNETYKDEIQKAKYAYVERVRESGDFSLLQVPPSQE